MNASAINVCIIVSEPWDSDKIIKGTVIQSLDSGKYWIIKENKSEQLYFVSCRYVSERLTDVLKQGKVIVGISIPTQEIDLLTISELTDDFFERLNYLYIGGMQLESES